MADGLGSTTALTGDTGSVTDTYEYDVFGNVRTETGSSANDFAYAGEQVDGSGLQYLHARYYGTADCLPEADPPSEESRRHGR